MGQHALQSGSTMLALLLVQKPGSGLLRDQQRVVRFLEAKPARDFQMESGGKGLRDLETL